MRTRTRLAGAIVLALLLAVSLSAFGCGSDDEETTTTEAGETTTTEAGETEAEAFPTKDITWIVPTAPGGGFDAYGRAVARYMPKHLPKEVNIVVKNISGAGNRTGTNALYRADPDGYNIGMLNVPGSIMTQLVQETEYDLNEMVMLGRIAKGTYALSVRGDASFDSIEDLQNADEELAFATVGATSTAAVTTKIAANVLDLSWRAVEYDGGGPVMVATIRGDTDAVIIPLTSQLEYIEGGELKPLAVFSEERSEFLPDVPTFGELGYEELDALGLHRMLAAPPGTPEDIATILREALIETLTEDEELAAWAEEADRPLTPAEWEPAVETLQTLTRVFEQYKDILE